jgi:hypothetical protein
MFRVSRKLGARAGKNKMQDRAATMPRHIKDGQ